MKCSPECIKFCHDAANSPNINRRRVECTEISLELTYEKFQCYYLCIVCPTDQFFFVIPAFLPVRRSMTMVNRKKRHE